MKHISYCGGCRAI